MPPLYGDVVEVEASYYSNDTLNYDRRCVYYFNLLGDVDVVAVYFAGDTEPTLYRSYSYDDQAVATEMVAGERPYDKRPEWRTTYTYNEQGLLIEEVEFYMTENILSTRFLYEYDSQGRRLHDLRYDGGDVLMWECLYKYDSEGRLLFESRRNYEDAANMGDTRYNYDAQGMLVAKEEFQPDYEKETKQITTYRYDELGHLVEAVTKSAGVVEYTTSFSYDKQGNVVEEVARIPDEQDLLQLVKYKITYRE